MNSNHRANRQSNCRRGAIAVMAAVVLIVMIAMIAFGIDVGMMMLDRTTAQTAVDASSLAAVSVMKSNGTEAEVVATARLYLTNNGVPTAVAEQATIQPGTWDADTRAFQAATYADANALQIQVTDSGRPLFFGRMLGATNFTVGANAIAAASGGGPQDIMLVIDCSTSMASHNRMPYTRDAAMVLVNELKPTDRLGLTVYSWPDPLDGNRKTGRLETVISFDHSPTSTLIPTLVPGYYGSGTNIAGGMRVGIGELVANPRTPPDTADQVLVVLTDGRANKPEPPGTDPWNSIAHYAGVAAANDITIHAITLGSNASEAAMQAAANTTGGEYHHIDDGNYSGLVDLFRTIGQGRGKPRLVD